MPDSCPFSPLFSVEAAMKFGLSLSNRGPQARPDAMMRFAQRAEALGYDSLAVSDHIVIPKAMPHNYPYHPNGAFSWQAARDFYEPLTTLMFLAGRTNRLRLGVSVLIVSYRNPVTTAKMLATLDALSEGRMFLGVGTGWWEDEYKALGIGDHFAERGARTDEYLRIYKVLWTEPNPEFKGRFHSFGNLEFSPKPCQPGGPPIWVGGHTTRALRRAAEFGDIWHPIGLRPPAGLEPKELGAKRRELHALAEKAGRDPAKIGIAFRCPLHLHASQRGPMAGTPQQVIDDIGAYQREGVSHFTFDIFGDSPQATLDAIQHAAEDVMPAFA
jgi:probable F420-dependent oxidoreductase